jgi:multiple sugar transport system permease protein
VAAVRGALPPVSGAALPRGGSREGRERLLGLALISPTMILFLGLIAYPLVASVVLSFYAVDTLSLRGPFVGLANYAALLRSREFWTAFGNTLIWTAGAVSLQLVLGIGFALMLHGTLFCRALARGLVLFPYLLPTAVAVLVWRWMFNDLYGIVDYVLLATGLVSTPFAWLSRMPDAMISIILVGAWKLFPFVVLAVLARLQTIPEQLYEAARIDGASAWARFWDITLPQLRGVLAIVILLRSIWDFKEFDLIYLMTGGGPATSTETLPLLVYKAAFPLLHLGRGAAVAVAMLLFMLLFFFLYFRSYGREEEGAR